VWAQTSSTAQQPAPGTAQNGYGSSANTGATNTTNGAGNANSNMNATGNNNGNNNFNNNNANNTGTANRSLPGTASPYPAIGLGGLVSLGGYFFIKSLRVARSS
jgi:uncharacterized protein YjcR